MTEVTRRPRKGEVVEVAIDRLDKKGDGLGRLLGQPEDAAWRDDRVRVRGGIPGASVRARVIKRKKGELGARLVDVLTPGEQAVEERCAHARSCGGCAFQGLSYDAQLDELSRVLEETLSPLFTAMRARGDEVPPIAPIRPAPDPFAYRNKMDFTFGTRRFVEPGEPEGAGDLDFALGLHARGLFQKVIDIGTCEIAFPAASPIVATARRLARERDLTPWDVRAHTGLLRLLVLRQVQCGPQAGRVLANLVTSEEAPEVIRPLVDAISAAHPEIATFVQTVQTRVAQIASGGREIVLHGDGFLDEELAGLSFRVSAASFFQTNTPAADVLARLVAERVATEGEAPGVVYDLCCGAGALGLVVAATGGAGEVLGFELVPEAVEDARRNAERNGIANARFFAGDLVDTLFTEGLPAPDVCIADPPRAGLHPKVTAELRRLAPPRIVYVSCNPTAAARDLAELVTSGYVVRSIEPLDLFPHTPHLECVFTLERA